MGKVKRCTYCNLIYLRTAEFFHRDKYQNDGLTSRCKICRNYLERLRRMRLKERMSK